LNSIPRFEIKSTDLAGRIGRLQTKSSKFETPALLPVIHPVRQLVPCSEIRALGYEAVMTNAYTTFRRLNERANEGIHRIIGFDGTVMTDSGGYQVLEFGSVEVDPLEIASFEEKIGSDIAIILDKPTGLEVTRKFAAKTVLDTLQSARKTLDSRTRDDIIWTLPVQGGKYLDLVTKSAKASAKLDYGCYALGSPVEVMENYDFPLLVRMILASKSFLPSDRPFHLFGAGHPLIIPLAIALGCDMFDSASYMLFAKNDRYISSSGTIRLEKLEYLPCSCKTCSSLNAQELKMMKKEERILALARHNLSALKLVIEEAKQAIWEERLWEYVRAKCSNHPSALEAFRTAARSEMPEIEIGTPRFKERGIFLFDDIDLLRPEVTRHRKRLSSLDLSGKEHLVITPETKTKPFLNSDLFKEILDLVDLENTLICYASPVFGLVPSEISDIFPISQVTHHLASFPAKDQILNARPWKRIDAMIRTNDPAAGWLNEEFTAYSKRKKQTVIEISKNYKSFKKKLSQV
jgi:7-cyano-7-deazaguanine tRNA-ribosyltransferase